MFFFKVIKTFDLIKLKFEAAKCCWNIGAKVTLLLLKCAVF